MRFWNLEVTLNLNPLQWGAFLFHCHRHYQPSCTVNTHLTVTLGPLSIEAGDFG